MFAQLALMSLAATGALDRPKVEVWTNRGDDPFTSGQAVRVYFQADRDAYVTVLRVDTDGRVRVLFPREPWEDNFARGGRVYEVGGATRREAFDVDDYPGVGYLFAVASADAFAYDPIETAEHWDYRSIAADGRIQGDPYVALTDLAQRIVPADYAAWDYDIAPYYVEQHYQYPRFLCYDCHTYVSYRSWDPYAYSCVRFRVVMYDDPYYYPYRQYGGARVVFTRPYRPEPRFIFKDRTGSDPFVTRVRERPVNDDRRRSVRIRVPTPNVATPRDRSVRPGTPSDAIRLRNYPDQPDRPVRPGRPDYPSSNPDRPSRPDHPDHPSRPDRPDHPDHPDHPDRPDHADRPNRPVESVGPERRGGRETVAPPERQRATPRAESQPQSRGDTRAEPKHDAPRESPKSREPELRRRKP